MQKEVKKVKEVRNEVEEQIEDELVGSYIFSPSITKKKTINGKPYIIRSYFKGGKDFNETIKQLAIKQAFKQAG